jgi:hypothetical protein
MVEFQNLNTSIIPPPPLAAPLLFALQSFQSFVYRKMLQILCLPARVSLYRRVNFQRHNTVSLELIVLLAMVFLLTLDSIEAFGLVDDVELAASLWEARQKAWLDCYLRSQ